jgi:hypothetical protein
MPERVGPHVKIVFAEMARLRVTYDEVEIGSGVRRASIKAWRKKNRPGLESLEAVLGFLGWDFIAVPRAKVLPEEVRSALQPIADKLNMTMPQTIAALVEIVTGVHERFPFMRDPTPQRPAPPRKRIKQPIMIHPDQFALLQDMPTHVAH